MKTGVKNFSFRKALAGAIFAFLIIAPSALVAQSATINITVDLDNYEEETTWTLTGPSGTVASGGSYGDSDDIISNDYVVTESGAYTFTINDSYGDGISYDGYSNENSNARYRIQVDGVSEYTSISFPNFGLQEVHNFNVTLPGGGGGDINVRDEFNSVSYSNNDGSVNWYANWVELSDNGLPGSGDVLIDNGRLRINSAGNGASRRVDLSTATNATLSFDIYAVDNGNDYWLVEASSNNGSSWETIQTYNPVNGTRSETVYYDLGSYISLTDQVLVRFKVTTGFADISGQLVTVDNVDISYTEGSVSEPCENEYTFDWYNSSTGQGNVWPITNGQSSYSQNYSLSGPLGNIGLTVELDNSDLQNIDYANQGHDGGPSWAYTSTNGQDANQQTYGDDYLTFGITADNSSQETSFTFTFDEPISLTNWEISDIDYQGYNALGSWPSYQDEVIVTANNAGTPVTLTYSNVGSEVIASGDNTTTISFLADYDTNVNGDVSPDSPLGMVFVSTNDFITSLKVIYTNGPSDNGPSDDQAIRLDGFSLCPERTEDNTGSIGDFVWYDGDQNGLQNSDGSSAGVNNVTVELFNSGGSSAGVTTTDTDGLYSFNNVSSGDYYLEFRDLPAGYQFTAKDQGGDDTLDSDVNTGTGQTDIFTLSAGQNIETIDAGIYLPETPSCPDNILSNPGFESDYTDWNLWGSETITNDSHSGTKAAYISDDGFNHSYSIPGSEGDVFTLIAWAKKTIDFGWSTIAIGFYDSGGSLLGWETTDVTSLSGYEEYTVIATAPVNTAYVSANADRQDGGGGALVVDDFCLTVVEGGTPPTHPDCDYLYAVADGGDILVYMPRDGSSGPITIGNNNVSSIEATALSLDGQTLYAANANQLGVLDWNTGNFTARASTFGTGSGEAGSVSFTDVDGLAFDPLSGIFYGTHRWTDGSPEDLLFQINPATGAHVPNAFGSGIDYVVIDTYDAVSLYDVDDIAINPIDGQMYGVINSSGGNDRIAKINKYTGDVTDVGRSHTSTANVSDVEGLAFHNSGTFYGVTGTNDAMYEIDVTNALFTFVHTMDNSGDYEAVAGLTCGSNLITGNVFIDTDQDGINDIFENGQQNVTVKLYRDVNNDGNVDGGDIFAQSIITDANGDYEFEVGTDGAFVIEIDETTLPAGAVMTTDNKEEADFVGYGNTDPNNDFGYHIPEGINPPTSPTCDTGTSILWENNIVVDGGSVTYDVMFNSGAITTFAIPGPYPAAFNGSVDITISEAISWDGYLNRSATGDQPNERFRVVFKKSGSVVWSSPYTGITGGIDEIDTGVESDEWVGPLGTSVNLPNGADEIILVHWSDDTYGEGDHSNANSVVPSSVCIGYSTSNASIGDFVWNDIDKDGIQDGGESGLNSVTVNLYTSSGVLSGTTTTNSSGYYYFTNVPPGEYFIDFILPANYGFSPRNLGGNDALDSDADPADGETAITVLTGGENDFDWDAGMYTQTPGSIGNFVWHDINYNGIQEAGEEGLENITVNLYNANGTFLGTETTNSSGLYSFTNIMPGDYFLEFIPPADHKITFNNLGGDDALDSDADPETENTEIFTLSDAENTVIWDVGMVKYASVGDKVWYDSDQDGIQDNKERGISDVTVVLYSSGGTALAKTKTNASGIYKFIDLLPDSYYLIFYPPSGFLISPQDQGGDDAVDSDINPTNGRTTTFVLISDKKDNTWDAGLYFAPADLTFSKSSDVECAEPGGVITYTLEAINTGAINHSLITINDVVPDGTSYVPQSTSVTGTFGNIIFVPSEVRDEFNAVSYTGNNGTDNWIGNWSELGESTSASYGRVRVSTYTGIETNAVRWGGNYDDGANLSGYGVVRSVDLENAISAELSFNYLRRVSGSAPSFSINVQVLPSGGSWTTVDNLNFSDADGKYNYDITSYISSVTGVRFVASGYTQEESSDYLYIDNIDVSYTKPVGTQVTETRTNGTGGTLDDGSMPNVITLVDEVNIPVGQSLIATFQVIVDDPINPSLEEIRNDAELETDLLSNIYIESDILRFCTEECPGNLISNPGFELDLDSWTVGAGKTSITSNAYTGTKAVTAKGPAVIFQNLSAQAGYTYSLNLWGFKTLPDYTYAGLYFMDGSGTELFDAQLEITSIGSYEQYSMDFVAPAGAVTVRVYFYTSDNTNNEVTVDEFCLTEEAPPTVYYDFGDLPSPYPTLIADNGPRHPALITGDVSMGIRMDSELGGEGLPDVNAMGDDLDNPNNDEDGVTFVTTLHPDRNAQVDIDMPALNSSGYVNAWVDFNTDGDFDDVGERIANDFFVEYGNSNSITFAVPSWATGRMYNRFRISKNSGEVTTYTGEAPSGEVEDYSLGSIGNFVWDDTNEDGIQDAGELGIQGVTINLLDGGESSYLDADGNPISTLTDANGYYEFPGLPSNEYLLEFILPNGYAFSPQDQGGDNDLDSDADVSTGRTEIIEPSPYTNFVYTNVDAGMYSTAPQLASIGNFVWEDEIANGIQDGGEFGFANVTVNLFEGDDTPAGSTTTDANGFYSFTDLSPGSYYLEFEEPNGYVFSVQNQGSDDTADSDVNQTSGKTVITVLASGENDMTWDAGLNWTGINGRIGDYVWYDDNTNGIQDDGGVTAGLESVKLTLFDGTNTAIDITYTDANGWYEFINLGPDNYTIILDNVTIPAGLDFQTYDYDGLLTPHAAQVTITDGETNLQLDFGYSDQPLPVTLASFKAEKTINGIKLIWITESEVENQGFILERRMFEDSDWMEIANFTTNSELSGQGTVTYSTTYEYMDGLVTQGSTYEYRLSDVDYDGVVTYHATEIVDINKFEKIGVPNEFVVNPAYPNPFNPSTIIEYGLPSSGRVKVAIYDILGHRVKNLVDEEQIAGWHKVSWHGADDSGVIIPAGMYFGVIITDINKKTIKLMYVK